MAEAVSNIEIARSAPHDIRTRLASLVDCALAEILLDPIAFTPKLVDAVVETAIVRADDDELSVTISRMLWTLDLSPDSGHVVDESMTFVVSGAPVGTAAVTVVTSPAPMPNQAHLGVIAIPVKYVSVQKWKLSVFVPARLARAVWCVPSEHVVMSGVSQMSRSQQAKSFRSHGLPLMFSLSDHKLQAVLMMAPSQQMVT